MAQKVQVILVDDFDGGEADETISFALDGVSYEIDLSVDNAEKLRESFAGYVASARRVGGRSGGGTRTRRAASSGRAPARATGAEGGGTTAEIREWARGNGFTVNERGRISANVLEAYHAAH